MHEVFISFSFEDQEIVNKIVNQLSNKHNITYWICTKDTRAGERYKREIVRAIKSCKIVVLIQSKNSVRSKEVAREISIAVKRQKIIIPFIIEESELEDDLEYDLIDVKFIDGTIPIFEDRIKDLAKEIRGKLEDNIQKKTDFNQLSNIEMSDMFIKKSQIMLNEDFIGRKSDIREVHQKITEFGKVFICGIGGIGKSEIAKKYAVLYKEKYDTVIWGVCESTLKNMLINDAGIAISNFSRFKEETDEEYFRRKLEKLKDISNEHTLFIIDNLDHEDENLEIIAKGPYKLLVTTRLDYSKTGMPVVMIGELAMKEQLQLFQQSYKRTLTINDETNLFQIFRIICGHTLTIELIGKLMQVKCIYPNEMLEILNNVETIQSNSIGKMRHGILTETVYFNIKHLFDISVLNENEKMLMMNLSLLPLEGIEYERFSDLCGIIDYEEIESLIQKSWIFYDVRSNFIKLHPLIQEMIKNEYAPDWNKCHIMISNMVGRLSDFQYRDLAYIQVWDYSELLESVYNKAGEIDLRYISSYEWIMHVFIHCEKYNLAVDLIKRCLELLERQKPYDAEVLGRFYYKLADIYQYMRNKKETYKFYMKSLEIYEKYNLCSLDYAHISASFAMFLMECEDRRNTYIYELLKRAKNIVENDITNKIFLEPSKEILKGRLLYQYAFFFNKIHRENLALKYAISSLQCFKSIQGSSGVAWQIHPTKIIALSYANLGKYEEAVFFANTAIMMAENYYGKYHYNVIKNMEILAHIYMSFDMPRKELKVWIKIGNILNKKGEVNTPIFKKTFQKILELQNNK